MGLNQAIERCGGRMFLMFNTPDTDLVCIILLSSITNRSTDKSAPFRAAGYQLGSLRYEAFIVLPGAEPVNVLPRVVTGAKIYFIVFHCSEYYKAKYMCIIE